MESSCSPEGPRIGALGRIELQRGNSNAALEQFDRFEREVLGSRLFGEVMLARAELLQMGGRMTEARGALERLLANENALGQEKAKALYLIGEIHMNEARPDLAIPYFQRLYVMQDAGAIGWQKLTIAAERPLRNSMTN